MTNREWLESLNDKQLSSFLTDSCALKIHIVSIPEEYQFSNTPFCGGIKFVSYRYTQPQVGIEKWLTEKQEFDIVE